MEGKEELIYEERYPFLQEKLLSHNWNREEIDYLLSLRYNNKERKILLSDSEILLEIIQLSDKYPSKEIISFFEDIKSREEVFFPKEIFQRAKELENREVNLQIVELKGVKGIGKCRYCGNEELIFNQAQTRAGDEGMTTFVNCPRCGRSWKKFN